MQFYCKSSTTTGYFGKQDNIVSVAMERERGGATDRDRKRGNEKGERIVKRKKTFVRYYLTPNLHYWCI